MLGRDGIGTDNIPNERDSPCHYGVPSGNGPLNVTVDRLDSIGTTVIIDVLEWGSIVCRDEMLGKENPG